MGAPLDGTPWQRGEKKVAESLVRVIVASTPDGVVSGDFGRFMAALLLRHPCASEKAGPGISFITLGKVPGHKSRGFTVHRTDGTSTDFSWRECIYPTPQERIIRDAMREAVDSQVKSFKQSRQDRASGLLRCEVTNALVTWDDSEVDHHDPSFLALAGKYASSRGGYQAILLTPSADQQIGRSLLYPDSSMWPRYHQDHARLRVLSRAAHREVTRQQRTTA